MKIFLATLGVASALAGAGCCWRQPYGNYPAGATTYAPPYAPTYAAPTYAAPPPCAPVNYAAPAAYTPAPCQPVQQACMPVQAVCTPCN